MSHTTPKSEQDLPPFCTCPLSESIPYLDTECKMKQGKIVTDLYRKPTDKHRKSCKKLPWELFGCQGVKVFWLKDVIITTSVTTVILITITIWVFALSQLNFFSFAQFEFGHSLIFQVLSQFFFKVLSQFEFLGFAAI